MLLKMRDNLQGWASKVIVGLIVITMAMFGFGAFDFFSQADPAAATVDGVEISRSRLASEVERQRQRIAAQLGNVDPSTLDTAMLESSVLEGLINRTLLLETADDMGLAVSQSEIDSSIVSNPDFHTNGVFDEDRFRTLLGGAGLTPVAFRGELASSYRLVQLQGGVNETPFVTDDERRALARILVQRRDLAFLTFDPAAVGATLSISEDEVADYYAARPDDFLTEESVDLAYVEILLTDLAADASIVIEDSDVVARYEADRAVFEGNEQRRASHILLEVNAERDEAAARTELEGIKARVLAGESFEELAKEFSEDPGSAGEGGDLGFVNKGAFVPEFETAVWSMQPAQMSEPVTTQFGVHLIRLEEVRAESYPSLEEKRGDVVASLRRSKAEELYAEKIRRLDEIVFENPSDLQTATTELGLVVKQAMDVKRSTGTGAFADERVLTAAFSEDVVARAFNSRVVDLGDRGISMRMIDHRPAARRELADVSDEIRSRIALERGREEVRARGAAALASVLAGDGAATIAAQYGLEWSVHERIRRTDSTIDGTILSAAFELPRPDVSTRVAKSLDLADGRVVTVMVTGVHDGDYAALSDDERVAFDTQLLRIVGNTEFNALFESIKADASIARR